MKLKTAKKQIFKYVRSKFLYCFSFGIWVIIIGLIEKKIDEGTMKNHFIQFGLHF